MTGHLYLEDLSVGQTFRSGTVTVDVEGIKRFAAEFDPQPFHLDEDAAQRSLFAGLAASGWHTAALTMRLLVEGGCPVAGGVIGAGVELAWPRPTRAGDILHVETEVIEILASRSRLDRGIVTVRTRTLTEDRALVQEMTSRLVVFRRPPDPSMP